jgi:hypothetical protein
MSLCDSRRPARAGAASACVNNLVEIPYSCDSHHGISKGSGSLSTRTKVRYRASVGALLFISVIGPLTILAGQASKLFTSGAILHPLGQTCRCLRRFLSVHRIS